MSACLPAGIQLRLVAGSIWNTWARVLKMGCSLRTGRSEDEAQRAGVGGWLQGSGSGQRLLQAHLVVDIGQAGLGALPGAARRVAGAAGPAPVSEMGWGVAWVSLRPSDTQGPG